MKTMSLYGLNKSALIVPVVAVSHCFITYIIASNMLPVLLGIDCDTVEGKATVTCCTFGNSGVLPLIFAEALFRHADPVLLQEATSKISLYVLGWSPYFWSFGRSKLLGNDGSSTRRITIKDACPPPVVGILTGLALSLFGPCRRLFVRFTSTVTTTTTGNGGMQQHKAPLGVLYNTVQNLGKAASPLALLVLTSSLALGQSSKSTTTTKPSISTTLNIDNETIDQTTTNSAVAASSPARRLVGVFITRFIISPLLMVGLLRLLLRLGFIDSIGADPMLWFILILEASMPPAQNSVLMLHAEDKSIEAARLAKFLFSVYFAAMIPVVIITTVLLEKCGIIV